MLIRRLPVALVFIVGLQVRSAHAQGSGGVTAPAAGQLAGNAGSAGSAAPAPTPAPHDGSGSAVAAETGSGATTLTTTTTASPSGATTTATVSLPDPTTDPLGFYNGLKAFWTKGGWLLVSAGAFLGLLEVAAAAGTKWKIAWLAWLGVGRVSTVIAGMTALVGALIASIATGNWAPFFSAVLAAGAAYLHLGGVDPAKAINPVSGNVTSVK